MRMKKAKMKEKSYGPLLVAHVKKFLGGWISQKNRPDDHHEGKFEEI